MVPDTRLRLSTAVKALDDIIAPALPQDARFAHEQLALIRRSVQIAIDQITHEYAFAVRDALDYLDLADALAGHVASDDPVGAALRSVVAKGRETVPERVPDRPGVEHYLRDLKKAVETTVETLCATRDGEDLRAIQLLGRQFVLGRIARQFAIGQGLDQPGHVGGL